MAEAVLEREGSAAVPVDARSDEPDVLANYLTMAGHLCTDINQGAIGAILPFLVVEGGYTYLQATSLMFAANVVSAVVQPLFGWLGDKGSRPWFMALGCFLAGLGMAGVGYMPSYPLVLLSAMVSGVGVAMFHPEGGHIANRAAGAQKGRGMSIFAVGGNVGFFVGPLMAAASLTAFGLAGTAVFLVPAIACAVVLLAYNARFIELDTAPQQSAAQSQAAPERWDLFAFIVSILSLRSILSYGVIAFVPLFLVGPLGQSTAVSSLAISAFSIAAAVASGASGVAAERVGTLRLMMICAAVSVVSLAVFVQTRSLAVALVLTMVLAVTTDLFYPAAVAHGMEYIPQHLGMASGLTYGVAVCVGGVASPFLGAAGDAFGLTLPMLGLAGVGALAAVLTALLMSADKRYRAAFPTSTAEKNQNS